jgi:hypothetical protein
MQFKDLPEEMTCNTLYLLRRWTLQNINMQKRYCCPIFCFCSYCIQPWWEPTFLTTEYQTLTLHGHRKIFQINIYLNEVSFQIPVFCTFTRFLRKYWSCVWPSLSPSAAPHVCPCLPRKQFHTRVLAALLNRCD